MQVRRVIREKRGQSNTGKIQTDQMDAMFFVVEEDTMKKLH